MLPTEHIKLAELPTPDSGLTVEDIKDTIGRLRANVGRFPELAFLLEDVPPEYDPDVGEGDLSVSRPRLVTLGPRVSRADKQKALAAIQQIFNEEAARINARLKAGDITVDEWLALQRKEVSMGHVSSYSAGRSGAWDSITFREWGRLGARIKRQFEFLKGFANEIREKGIDAFSQAKLDLRISLYGDNMTESLHAGSIQDRGVDPSVLPALPGDGTTRCLVRCKCRWTVRPNGKDRWLVSWRLGRAEHCRTCLDRADDWVNLEIHKGRMISNVIPHFYNHN